eukprot:scaffold7108_cov129-Isochrysis_galbana.AAC.3
MPLGDCLHGKQDVLDRPKPRRQQEQQLARAYVEMLEHGLLVLGGVCCCIRGRRAGKYGQWRDRRQDGLRHQMRLVAHRRAGRDQRGEHLRSERDYGSRASQRLLHDRALLRLVDVDVHVCSSEHDDVWHAQFRHQPAAAKRVDAHHHVNGIISHTPLQCICICE